MAKWLFFFATGIQLLLSVVCLSVCRNLEWNWPAFTTSSSTWAAIVDDAKIAGPKWFLLLSSCQIYLLIHFYPGPGVRGSRGCV